MISPFNKDTFYLQDILQYKSWLDLGYNNLEGKVSTAIVEGNERLLLVYQKALDSFLKDTEDDNDNCDYLIDEVLFYGYDLEDKIIFVNHYYLKDYLLQYIDKELSDSERILFATGSITKDNIDLVKTHLSNTSPLTNGFSIQKGDNIELFIGWKIQE